MKLVKKLLLWFAVILLTAIALGTISSLACIPALAAALLIAPIAPLQKFIRKFIKGKVKGIIVALLVILIIVASPKNNTTLESDSPEGTSTESVSISEDTDIETISDVITEPEAVATTEAVTEIETVATT